MSDADILRTSPHLAGVSSRLLRLLWDDAEIRRCEPGATLYTEGDPTDGFYALESGALSIKANGRSITVLSAPALIGDAEFFEGGLRPITMTASSRAPAVLRCWSSDRLRSLLESTPALDRMVKPPAHIAPHGVADGYPAEIVQLASAGGLVAPLAALSDLLAQDLVQRFPERVLLLHVVDSGAVGPEAGPLDPRLARLRVPRGELVGTIKAQRYAHDYILLDVFDLSPDGTVDYTGGLVDTWFFFTRDATRPAPPPGARPPRILQMRLISEPGLVQRLSLPVGEIPLDVSAPVRVQQLQARLDLDLVAELWRQAQRRLALADVRSLERRPARGAPSSRDVLGAWSRALTCRQLWLALGGGGVLGFAHAELIRQMLENDLPIDGLSGTSFGSVIGAFYAAMPAVPSKGALPEGLTLLLDRRRPLQLAINAGVISSYALELAINAILGFPQLDGLAVPFLPVATDIASTKTAVITGTTAGFGVRASGAFPVLFTPATTPTARYVDGTITDLVPSNVASGGAYGPMLAAEQCGADLVVASNAIPSAIPRAPQQPCLPGSIGRLIFEFNLLNRAIDGLRSGYVLLHRTGGLEAEASGDVVYQAGTNVTGFEFWNLRLAEAVMSATAQTMAKQRTIARIKAQWDRLSKSRRRPGAVAPPA